MSNLMVVPYSKAIDIQEYLMINFEKCCQKFMHMQSDGLNLIVFMECFHFMKTISSAIEKNNQLDLFLYWCEDKSLTIIPISKVIDMQDYLNEFENCRQKFMKFDNNNPNVYMDCYHFMKKTSSAIEKYRQSGLSLYWCKINQVNPADSD